MKLRSIVVIALFAFSSRAQDSGVVQGVVLNSITGVGIPGATVRLIFRTDRYETVTDGVGTFQFSGVKPGDYVASGEKCTFTASRPTAFPPRPIHVAASKEPMTRLAPTCESQRVTVSR